jgi:hypothetical protein
MPQPITNLVRDPYVVIDDSALAKLPDMAILVCNIFARWASIERELNVLLARLLKAEEAAAHSIFAVLQTQALQTKALEAAAKATLSSDRHAAFLAAMSVVSSVQKTRNKLAHWIWATCKQRPDLLLLADPQSMKARDRRALEYWRAQSPGQFNPQDAYEAIRFDNSAFLAFGKSDLEREIRDLTEGQEIVLMLGMLLDPALGVVHAKVFGLPEDPDAIRDGVLEKLRTKPLFQMALDQIHARQ